MADHCLKDHNIDNKLEHTICDFETFIHTVMATVWLLHSVDISNVKVQWAFGSFSGRIWLNIHCNGNDLEMISMDITENLATSRYYLCLKLELHCMKAQKGGTGTENGYIIIILN